MLLIDLPLLNPIAIQVGPLSIHWYGIMYLLGFIIVYLSLRTKPSPLKENELAADYVFWAAMGVIIGGRLGYVLFYNLPYYLTHPQEMLAIWSGGMSFHGGLLGVIIATFIWTRKHKQLTPFWRLMDFLVFSIPFTLALGRIGNFINGELYGRLSDLPWAMHFPRAYGYRHPVQIYEALLHILAALFLIVTQKWTKSTGLRSSLFLIFYGIIRISIEFFREPDSQIGFIAHYFTLGQLLTLPVLLGGIIFFILKLRKSGR